MLVDYFERTNKDYIFIILTRHPCLLGPYIARNGKEYRQSRLDMYSRHVRDTIANVPQDRQIVIQYHDLITRPDLVARAILDKFPEFASFDPGTTGFKRKIGPRAPPVRDFLQSKSCRLKVYAEKASVEVLQNLNYMPNITKRTTRTGPIRTRLSAPSSSTRALPPLKTIPVQH